jgi:hypothetical protein
VLLLLAAAALLFLAGLGIGRAIEQAPPPAGEVTHERQLDPLPLGDAVTVTVTVTAP